LQKGRRDERGEGQRKTGGEARLFLGFVLLVLLVDAEELGDRASSLSALGFWRGSRFSVLEAGERGRCERRGSDQIRIGASKQRSKRRSR